MNTSNGRHKEEVHRAVERNRIIDELFSEASPFETRRMLRIMEEFTQGFDLLKTCELAASFFGSARCTLGDKLYEEARELAGKLSKDGFAVITGGGGGVMQAANHGAFDAGGRSIGFNIKIQNGQPLNAYTTESMTFHHFFTRKVMLAYASEVYIFFPGGFGTLDELMEMLTLIQTKKIKRVPVVLVGREFWTPFLELIRSSLYEKYATIDKEDMELYHLVDSLDEAYRHIIRTVKR